MKKLFITPRINIIYESCAAPKAMATCKGLVNFIGSHSHEENAIEAQNVFMQCLTSGTILPAKIFRINADCMRTCIHSLPPVPLSVFASFCRVIYVSACVVVLLLFR